MLSSHRRRIDGALNRRAKRRQSVKTVIEREKALSNSGHSARAPNLFKLFKNLRRSVTNYGGGGGGQGTRCPQERSVPLLKLILVVFKATKRPFSRPR